MTIPIKQINLIGAGAAQSVRTEILRAEADFATAGGREIVLIRKLGTFGAVTATFGLYKGRKVIAEEGSACDATTFGGNWDNVPEVNIVLMPNESLKCWMIDSAVDPLGLTFAILGKILEIGTDI